MPVPRTFLSSMFSLIGAGNRGVEVVLSSLEEISHNNFAFQGMNRAEICVEVVEHL